MFKPLLSVILCTFLLPDIVAQPALQPSPSSLKSLSQSRDKPAWQWLNLMSGATFYRVVKEGEVDFNSCLLHASRSLGVSRFHVLAEG